MLTVHFQALADQQSWMTSLRLTDTDSSTTPGTNGLSTTKMEKSEDPPGKSTIWSYTLAALVWLALALFYAL